MPKGISLHIGLNRVDPVHYGGWDGQLMACEFDANDMMDLARAAEQQGQIMTTHDPREAVRGADCVITDTWVSMGDTDHDERLDALEPYQVDTVLMDEAAGNAVFLHCLPAHRGEEVTDEVIDGPASLVWDEAENRIHAQKSILAWCFGAI